MSIEQFLEDAAAVGILKPDLRVMGDQTVGSTLTGAYAKGSGTFVFIRTPIAGGVSADIGSTVSSPSIYTVLTSDRGYIIGARPVAYLPPKAAGIAIPVVAPLAPTITNITAGDGSVTVTLTRNVDNGGDTVTGDRIYVWKAADNSLTGSANGTSPITLSGIPSGTPVYATAASIGASKGVGPQSAASNTVTPGMPLLRFASPYNRVAGTTVSMGAGKQTATASAQLLTIGSGNRKNLRVRFENGSWQLSGFVPTGNTVTLSDIWVVHNGIAKQALYGGLTSRVVADGEVDVLCDPFLPSDFGVTSFDIGVATAVRGILTCPAGGKIPFQSYSDTGNRGLYYDPAVTIVSNINAAVTTASISTTGIAPTVSFGSPFQLVGEFVSGDPLTIANLGDSFKERGPQVSPTLLAMLQAPMIAGCQIGKSGGEATLILNSPVQAASLIKYACAADDGFGTNSVNANRTLTKMQTDSRGIWALARSSAVVHPSATPFKIFRSRLLTIVTGSATTLTGQTTDPKWVQGALADQFWAWLQTQVGVSGGVDAAYDPYVGPGGTVRGSTDVNSVDYYKFAPGMTDDNTHLVNPGAVIAGNNTRPAYA